MNSKKPSHFPTKPAPTAGESSCSPFPSHVLPDRLKAMACSVAEVSRVPMVMPCVVALAIVSAALGKGLRIGEVYKTMGNLFFLMSARSGAGKSIVLRFMTEPIKGIEDFLEVFRAKALRSSSKRKRNQESDRSFEGFAGSVGLSSPPGHGLVPDSPIQGTSDSETPRLLMCSDVTEQAFAKLLQENQECLLNVTPEAGNLLMSASAAGSGLGLLLLKSYSGDSVVIHRISRKPVKLDEPCVTVCWLCQPHRLDDFLASDRLMEDGLLARFHVVHSQAVMAPLPEEDQTIPMSVRDNYGALISSLYDAYGLVDHYILVDIADEAKKTLKTYHNQCVERWHSEPESSQPCIARWAEQAWKLTLVLHAAKHGSEAHKFVVNQQTAESAVILQEWFADQQMRIIRGNTGTQSENRLNRLCELLRSAPRHEMTLRDLSNSHEFSKEEISFLVASAPSLLNLQIRQNPRGGPRSCVLVLTEASQ